MEREHQENLSGLRMQLGRVILGKPEVIENVIIAFLSGGHILVEDVPGVGKTTLAKAVARQNSNCTSKVILKGVSPTEIGWVGGHGC